MKKGKFLIGVCIVILLAAIVVPPIWTAHCIREYLAVINPHFAPYAARFATYNPVNSDYNMTVTDDSGASIFLECNIDGLIVDEIRKEQYYEENDLTATVSATEDGYGLLYCLWPYNDPLEPQLNLTVMLRSDGDEAPPESPMFREQMEACLLDHYAALPTEAADHVGVCRVYYVAGYDEVYEIRVELPKGALLTQELVAAAEMTKNT